MKTETLVMKIRRYEKLQKHYREALWEAEKTAQWNEALLIKNVLSQLEPYLEKLVERRLDK